MRLHGNELLRSLRRGEITIAPFREDRWRGSSYPLHLAEHAVRILDRIIDPREAVRVQAIHIPQTGYLMQPGDYLMGHLQEAISSDWWIPAIQWSQTLGLSPFAKATFSILNHRRFNGRVPLLAIEPAWIFPGMELATVSFIASQERALSPQSYSGRSRTNPFSEPGSRRDESGR